MKTRTLFFSVTWIFVFFTTNLHAAPSDLNFYKGKVITYIVATKPGGGYDAYARLIGKYMQKYIPESTLVVKNIPGAGHIIGANETYLAKSDGLTIGSFNTGLIYAQLIGQPGIKFDLPKYSWIGKAYTETRVFIIGPKTPYKSVKDLREVKEPVKVASAGVGSQSHQETLILAEALGVNIKPIPGYMGREDEMAIMRGEVAGTIGSYLSLRPFVKAEGCRILLQIGTNKNREIPDVPLAQDVAPSEKGKKLLTIVATIAEISRLTAAPPNVPTGRLEVLRGAYKKALTDPGLIGEIEKMGFGIDAAYGEEIAKLVKEVMDQPEENIAMLKKVVKID